MFLEKKLLKNRISSFSTGFRVNNLDEKDIWIWAPQEYLTTSPDFARLLSLSGIARSMLMQLEPYLGSFPCISSCLMEEVN